MLLLVVWWLGSFVVLCSPSCRESILVLSTLGQMTVSQIKPGVDEELGRGMKRVLSVVPCIPCLVEEFHSGNAPPLVSSFFLFVFL